ncbi:hypothetical protein PAMP_020938 [Pampus punctatissimus]
MFLLTLPEHFEEHQDTVPPPPPTPPSFGIHPKRRSPPPCPIHAALPFNRSPPVQETRPSPNCGVQGAVAPSPQLTVQNGHQPSLSHGDFSDCDDKSHPVQETAPAPQALNAPQASAAEVGVQEVFQMSPGGVEH